MIDKILEQLGLKYEDLSRTEQETFESWSTALEKSVVTISDVRNYVSSMRDSVEQELTKVDYNNKQDILLKARLRNYMLLEAFLSTPEKARQALDRAMAGLVKKKSVT